MKGHRYKIYAEESGPKDEMYVVIESQRKGRERALDKFFEVCEDIKEKSTRNSRQYIVSLVHVSSDETVGSVNFHRGKRVLRKALKSAGN